MAIKLRTKKPDPVLKQIVKALKQYAEGHPKAEIEVYRHNNVSVRIRIIDPTFKGMSRAQREVDLWAILNELPEEVVQDISLLILLTPVEAKKSFASMEFDDPIPARI
jgi:stress-induced morphogen